MCRLLGIVANELMTFRLCLHEAPRSLSSLSEQHPDGWGVAVYRSGQEWIIEKSTICANRDARFGELATVCDGEVLIGHVRKRTVGESTFANTHPFGSGRWVFAHNGTVREIDYLRGRISPERRAGLAGETDSELLFAFLLCALDQAGLADRPAGSLTDRVLIHAVQELAARRSFGTWNFLLSNGDVLYAFRCGRELHMLVRDHPPVERVRPLDSTGIVVDAPALDSHRAVLIASEPITDEPWIPVENGKLLRIDRSFEPEPRVLFHWHNIAIPEES